MSELVDSSDSQGKRDSGGYRSGWPYVELQKFDDMLEMRLYCMQEL